MALLPEQSTGRDGGADGGNGMQTAVFSRWRTNATVEDTRIEAGDITVHVIPASSHITVAVAGRVTVDSSPNLRSALLDLLSRKAALFILVDFSGVSYLDMSGLATLLEALKAAREHLVRLRVTGISGKARTLAEIAQLDTIFRAWGSDVEFQ
jgi:anti-sigma B factor antagonist